MYTLTIFVWVSIIVGSFFSLAVWTFTINEYDFIVVTMNAVVTFSTNHPVEDNLMQSVHCLHNDSNLSSCRHSKLTNPIETRHNLFLP